MKNLKKLSLRLIASILLASSLSACVTSGQPAPSLYYQPSLYGYAPAGATAMEIYMVPRR